MARFRMAASRHDGFSLAETLVAMGVFTVILGIVTGVVVTANQVTRRTTEGVFTQSQLLDAVNRVSRDVASADPVIKAEKNQVTVQVIRGPGTTARCTRSLYYVNPAKVLVNQVTTFRSVTCPDPADAVGTTPFVAGSPVPAVMDGAPKTSTVTSALTNETAGLFIYYDADNRVISAPVTNENLLKVARVGIRVDSAVRDRPKGVKLVTSAAIRKGLTPDVVSTDNTLLTPTLQGRLISNTGRLWWPTMPSVTGWVLTRDGEVIARINSPSTPACGGQVGPCYDDKNLVPNKSYEYEVYGVSSGGATNPSAPVTLMPRVGDLPATPTDVTAEVPYNGSGLGNDPTLGPQATTPNWPNFNYTPADKARWAGILNARGWERSGGGAIRPSDINAPDWRKCQFEWETEVLAEETSTGGLIGKFRIRTEEREPLPTVESYQVPIYEPVKRERPVYGVVTYQIPRYQYITYQVPVYGTTTVSMPIYGFNVSYQPVYGQTAIFKDVPVYGMRPVPKRVKVEQWVRINDRAVFGTGGKCYVKGSAPLPNPDCRPIPPSVRYVALEQTGGSNPPFLTFMGNNRLPRQVSGGNDARFARGGCDQYNYIKAASTYQANLGNYTTPPDPFAPGSPDGRWRGPNGYGWYMACKWQPTERFEVTYKTVLEQEYGIIGYTKVFDRYDYGIVRYDTIYTYGIVGYTPANSYGVVGYQTYGYNAIVGYDTGTYTTQIGTEVYDNIELVRYETRFRTIIGSYSEADYQRTYKLDWAGIGPCPGAGVPSAEITRVNEDYQNPRTLTLSYDGSGVATLRNEEGVIVNATPIPQKCI